MINHKLHEISFKIIEMGQVLFDDKAMWNYFVFTIHEIDGKFVHKSLP